MNFILLKYSLVKLFCTFRLCASLVQEESALFPTPGSKQRNHRASFLCKKEDEAAPQEMIVNDTYNDLCKEKLTLPCVNDKENVLLSIDLF